MDSKRQSIPRLLAALDLFDGADDKFLQQLATAAESLHFCEGTPVWLAGMETTLVIGITEGQVELLYHHDTAGNLRVDTYGAGQLVAVAEVLTPMLYRLSACATEPTDIVAICADHFRHCITSSPTLHQRISEAVHRREHRLMSQLTDARLNPNRC